MKKRLIIIGAIVIIAAIVGAVIINANKKPDYTSIKLVSYQNGRLYCRIDGKMYMFDDTNGLQTTEGKIDSDYDDKENETYNSENVPDGYEILSHYMIETSGISVDVITKPDVQDTPSYIMLTHEDGKSVILTDYYLRYEPCYRGAHDDKALYFWSDKSGKVELYAYVLSTGDIRCICDYRCMTDAENLYSKDKNPCTQMIVADGHMYTSMNGNSDILMFDIEYDNDGYPVKVIFNRTVYEYK